MLSEVPEHHAPPDIAAIYARIRRAQGTPLVNLIWRHLATIDGALAWAWPTAEAALPRIRASAGPMVAFADECVGRHRLGDGVALDLRPDPVLDVVHAYERGNCWNLLAMTVLAAVRAGAPAPSGGALPPAPDAPAAIPAIPRYDRLDPAARALVDQLADVGPVAVLGLRPSLWVHLTLWPGVLRGVADACTPILQSRPFLEAHAETLDHATSLLGLAPPGPAPDAAIDAAIGRFRPMIAEMLLIGRVLLRGARQA